MPTAAKPPARPPLPHGTVLLDIVICERAVPWKASTVGRYGAFKDKNLVEWQDTVRQYAELNRTIDEPYWATVQVDVAARFDGGQVGDCTNITKSIEDSMQGVVFANDRQVCKNSCERTLSGVDYVRITVTAIDMPVAEFPDTGEAE